MTKFIESQRLQAVKEWPGTQMFALWIIGTLPVALVIVLLRGCSQIMPAIGIR